jgi:hypothetical protein
MSDTPSLPQDPGGASATDLAPTQSIAAGTAAAAASAPTATPTAAALQGRDGRLLQLGGQALLAYSLYSVAAVLLLSGQGPEVVFARISQLVNLFPLILLSGVLLFAGAGRSSSGNVLQKIGRWFVLIAAVMYLLFVPLIFLNEFHLYQQDTNQIQRLRTTLGKRKKEILTAVADARSAQEFREILARFPEISDIDIKDSETPTEIRRGITIGIDQGISAAVEPALSRLQQRIGSFSNTVRVTAVGSLISGLGLFALAVRLHSWLAPAGVAMQRTGRELLTTLTRLPKRLLPKRRGGSGSASASSGTASAPRNGGLKGLQRKLSRSLRRLSRASNRRQAAATSKRTSGKRSKKRERRRRRIQ